MNRDEVQYFLSHVYVELLLEKSLKKKENMNWQHQISRCRQIVLC